MSGRSFEARLAGYLSFRPEAWRYLAATAFANLGLAIGWLYFRTGSLLPAFLAHWLLNMAVSLG